MQLDGRRFAPALTLTARPTDDGKVALYAPSPGLWRGAPPKGALVTAGAMLGELEVLGVIHRLLVPRDAFGAVVALPEGRRMGRRPVDASTPLVVLDPEAAAGHAQAGAVATAAGPSTGPVFRTPLGGRYYARPAPDADAFVSPGDPLVAGTTLALIEVMKTFNRVTYGGDDVPERARVKRIVPADGDDVEAGDVLIELEDG